MGPKIHKLQKFSKKNKKTLRFENRPGLKS